MVVFLLLVGEHLDGGFRVFFHLGLSDDAPKVQRPHKVHPLLPGSDHVIVLRGLALVLPGDDEMVVFEGDVERLDAVALWARE